MTVPEEEIERFSLLGGAVADTLNLKALLKTLADPVNHIGNERSCEPVERAALAGVIGTGNEDFFIFDGKVDDGMHFVLELPFWPFDRHLLIVDGNFDSVGNRNRHSSYARHYLCKPLPFYQTSQITSPPTFASRDCLSVSTPLGVEIMATPNPPITRGSSRAFR